MSRPQFLWLLDRIPRYASLLGLLGLIGLAGLFDPAFYRLSTLSFLSYLAIFRFFRRFIDPDYGPTVQSAPFLLLAVLGGRTFLMAAFNLAVVWLFWCSWMVCALRPHPYGTSNTGCVTRRCG